MGQLFLESPGIKRAEKEPPPEELRVPPPHSSPSCPPKLAGSVRGGAAGAGEGATLDPCSLSEPTWREPGHFTHWAQGQAPPRASLTLKDWHRPHVAAPPPRHPQQEMTAQ